MKKGLNAQAYTIVEVMIVLAVTGALLVMIMFYISGQQGRTEFSQAMNDIQAQIKDVINNVATGYYANSGNYSCTSVGSGPNLSSVSTTGPGTNQDCIFIGRAIQFAVNSKPSSYSLYSLVGQRKTGPSGKDVSSLSESVPTAIAPGQSLNASAPDASDNKLLSYGLTVKSMRYVDGSNPINSACPSSPNCIGTVAFVSSFAAFDNSGNLSSGSGTVNLVPVPGSALNQTSRLAVDAIDTLKTSNPPINPSHGVAICFESGGSNQSGTITIGGNSRDLTTDMVINSYGSCP